MGIFSSRPKSLLELKIDGKNVDEREHDDNEDLTLDGDDDYTVDNDDTDNTDTDDNTDDQTGDDQNDDYDIPDDQDDGETTDDNTDDGGTDDNSDDATPDDTNDSGNAESTDDSSDDGSGDDEDLSLDDGGDDSGADDGATGDSMDTGDDTGTKNELQELEDELFKDMTPEQLSIKQIELKQQYVELFNSVSDIINRVNKITKTAENTNAIEFIINKMIELKDLIHFYLNNTYATKTYIENEMNYQQYIAILMTINKLLAEIVPKTGNSK